MKPHYIEQFKETRSVLMMKDYDEWRFLCALIRLVYPEERRTHYKKTERKILWQLYNVSDVSESRLFTRKKP